MLKISTAITCAWLTLCVAQSATAQLPPGDFLVSASTGSNTFLPGGLFRVDRSTGAGVPITGLPTSITPAAPPPPYWGPSFIEQFEDGRVVTGGSAGVGAQVTVLTADLVGDHAVVQQTFDVGESLFAGARVDSAFLDDQNNYIVIGVDPAWIGTPNDPLFGHTLGIIDVPFAQVHPLPASGMVAGIPTALAVVDHAYLVVAIRNLVTATTHVYGVSYPGGGAANEVFSTAGNIRSMTVRPDGNLWLAWNGPFSQGSSQYTGMVVLDTMSGVLTPHSSGSPNIVDFVIEPSSNSFLAAEFTQLFRGTPSGSAWNMASNPFDSSLFLTGIVTEPIFRRYGQAGPGLSSYEWQTAPNPGGFPAVGNSGFSLTVAASGPPALLDAVLVSTQPAPGPLVVQGIDVLVDPNSLIGAWQAAGSASMTVPLPIPNLSGLAGLPFVAQSVHIESTANFAWSDGLLANVR